MLGSSKLSLTRLVLVPAILTLAVTLLRVAGELLQWSPKLFNRDAGGGGALVGIVLLIPIFGMYFALINDPDGNTILLSGDLSDPATSHQG